MYIAGDTCIWKNSKHDCT